MKDSKTKTTHTFGWKHIYILFITLILMAMLRRYSRRDSDSSVSSSTTLSSSQDPFTQSSLSEQGQFIESSPSSEDQLIESSSSAEDQFKDPSSSAADQSKFIGSSPAPPIVINFYGSLCHEKWQITCAIHIHKKAKVSI